DVFDSGGWKLSDGLSNFVNEMKEETPTTKAAQQVERAAHTERGARAARRKSGSLLVCHSEDQCCRSDRKKDAED
ncbi:hypothetical protein KUCAC02_016529, partial [Chaenocephalus aceratus]